MHIFTLPIIKVKENDITLLTKEITYYILKVPKYKIKYTINISYITEEEATIIQHDKKDKNRNS